MESYRVDFTFYLAEYMTDLLTEHLHTKRIKNCQFIRIEKQYLFVVTVSGNLSFPRRMVSAYIFFLIFPSLISLLSSFSNVF